MKKLRILFAVAILGIATLFATKAGAQAYVKNPAPMINPNGFALDTATQAAAEGPKTIALNGTFKTVSIVVVTTKISGTIAGTISWQGSNDGVNFATISTTSLVDASTNYLYKEVDKGFLYYKALITQSGTSSLSYKAVSYTTNGPLNK